MAQYQSFPGVDGDSHTLDKLKAMRMPPLEGRSFLDIGCNEGFFCGFAKFQGARRSMGIDHSAAFVERARVRFPDCEFLHQGWDRLPDETFDVILLASALHYADDQGALLRRLMERINPGGTLVLELGVSDRPGDEWIKVQRGIDERFFPTWAKLHELLQDYAWKHVGVSVTQRGDPVRRHVLHVSARRPVAYLLMQPPAYGKSSIARSLFAPAGLKVVAGDHVMIQVARGKLAAPPALQAAIAQDFSPFTIDQTIRRVFSGGLGTELVALWVAQGGARDFAIDAFVPPEHQAEVVAALEAAGKMPVQLNWERVGAPPPPAKVTDAQAEAYFRRLKERFGTQPVAVPRAAPASRAVAPVRGVVDDLILRQGRLKVRGWAVTAANTVPTAFALLLQGRRLVPEKVMREERPDVQRHLKLDDPLLGFLFEVELDAGRRSLAGLASELSVVASAAPGQTERPLTLGAMANKRLAGP